MPSIGDVYVDVLPDLSGLSDALTGGLTTAAEAAGQAAGEVAGAAMGQALGSGLTSSESDVASAAESALQAAGESAAEAAGAHTGETLAAAVADTVTQASDQVEGAMTDALTQAGSAAGEEAGTAAGDAMAQGSGDALEAGLTGAVGAKILNSFGALGTAAGGAFSGFFGFEAIKSFEETEKQYERTVFGLRKAGIKGAEDLANAFTESAVQFARATGMNREQIEKLQANLVNLAGSFITELGPQKALKAITHLTQGLLDMSAATGRPLQIMMRTLGPQILNAPERAVAMLERLGGLTDIQADRVKQLVAEGKKQAATQEIINDLTKRFGGAAVAAATPLALLHERIDEINIAVGRVFSPLMRAAVAIVSAIPTPVTAATVAVGAFTVAITILKLAMGKLATPIKDFLGSMLGIGKTVAHVATTEISLTGALEASGGAFTKLVSNVKTAAASLVKFVAANWETIASLGALVAIGYVVYKILQNNDKAAKEAAASVDRLDDTLMRGGDASKEFAFQLQKYNEQTKGSYTLIGKFKDGIAELFGKKTQAEIWADVYAQSVRIATDHTANLAHTLAVAAGLSDQTGQAFERWYRSGGVFPKVQSALDQTNERYGNLIMNIADTRNVADAQRLTLAELLGQYVKLTGGTEGLNLAQLNAEVTAGHFSDAIKDVKAAADVAGVSLSTTSDKADVLARVAGTTGDQLTNQLTAAFTELKSHADKGRASLQQLISSTEQSIHSWAQGIGQSVGEVNGEFDNLSKKSNITVKNILRDSANFIRDVEKRARDTQIILKRAGAQNEQVLMSYLQNNHAMTTDVLDKIAHMSDKAFSTMIGHAQKWQGAIDKTSNQAASEMNVFLVDLVKNIGDVTGAFDRLNAMHVTTEVSAPGLAMTNQQVQELAQGLSKLSGVSINVSLSRSGTRAGSLHAGRHAGGPVWPGQAYLVGEKGPELFTPDVPGHIIPHHELHEGGSGLSPNRQAVRLVVDGAEFAAYVEQVAADQAVARTIVRSRH